MSTLVVADYLRRYRWIIIPSALLHLVMLYLAWQTPSMTIVIFLIGFSPFLLAFEINRHGSGISRVLLSLPITARQLAVSWRMVAFDIPAILFSLILLISAAGAALFSNTTHLTADRLIIVGVFQILMLGLSFFALTGLRLQPQANRNFKRQLIETFFGLLWGMSIPGAMFLMNSLPTQFAEFKPVHWLVASLAAIATCSGFYRSTNLLNKRSIPDGAPLGSQKPAAPPEETKERKKNLLAEISRFGGLPYLMILSGRRILIFGLCILTVNWAGMRFFFGLYSHQAPNSGSNTGPIMASQFHFAIPFVALMTTVMLLAQLRTLRSLPIRRSVLCSFILLWPIGFTILFAAAAAGIFHWVFQGVLTWDEVAFALAGTPVALLCVPIILRFGFRLPVLLSFFILAPGIMMFGNLGNQFQIEVASVLSLTIAGALFSIVWILSYRTMATSHPWRAGMLKLPNQQRRI